MSNQNLNGISRNASILIVDDNIQNIQLAVTFLKQYRFEILIANNGMEALSVTEKTVPDLILLDVMMPKMDGFEVCRRLKANPKTEHVPVVFLTAKREIEDVIRGFQCGGVDYITKPFHQEELIARVSTHIELKLSRDTIVQQNRELSRLNEEKNSILQISAHDLKNPLQGIYGLVSILELQYENLDADDVSDLIRSIKTATETANSIIQDLLEVQAIEEGKMTFNKVATDVIESTKRVMDDFKLRIEEKDQTVLLDTEEPEFLANVDPIKFERVIANLLSNALKFSPEGKRVWIKIYSGTNRSGNRSVTIEVKDEGPGIKRSEFDRLFTPFGKLSNRPTKNEPSTGLGLSIVKKMCESMNGTVWCESEEGVFTSFFAEFEQIS